MADLALKQKPNGKYGLLIENGNAVPTQDWAPAIIRLLIQGGPWIGDDGERTGPSLVDVKFIGVNTKAEVERIVETRLGALLRKGILTEVQVLDVRAEEGVVVAYISVTRPGSAPATLQVPVGK